jgi:hypothetical protein
MDQELKDKVTQQVGALDVMYKDGQIGLDMYGRFMVKLAHDLMVGDELQMSVGVCTGIPDQYFEDIMPGQMVDDDEFAQVAEYLSNRFKIHGLVEPEYTINILPRLGIA